MHNKNLRTHRIGIKKIQCNSFTIGNDSPLFLIAGPCLVEDISICKEIAKEAKRICNKYGLNYIFKASFDKSNKTIPNSYRGPGWEKGLEQLKQIKKEIQTPIITDIHEREQCDAVAEVADIIQIPALLSKQIDLILDSAKTGKIINIKKGQFTAPWEIKNILSRLSEEGYDNVMITERGTMFGYQTLVSDMRSLQIISQFGYPVIFDGSHSVHGNNSIVENTQLKHRDFILPLVRSAVANGIDGLFLEIHPYPDKAKSDPIGTFPLEKLEKLVEQVVEIDKALIN